MIQFIIVSFQPNFQSCNKDCGEWKIRKVECNVLKIWFFMICHPGRIGRILNCQKTGAGSSRQRNRENVRVFFFTDWPVGLFSDLPLPFFDWPLPLSDLPLPLSDLALPLSNLISSEVSTLMVCLVTVFPLPKHDLYDDKTCTRIQLWLGNRCYSRRMVCVVTVFPLPK